MHTDYYLLILFITLVEFVKIVFINHKQGPIYS